MLYTFTSYESIYDLYVAILKTAIIAAVALSLLVSLDRLYKVGKYIQVAARVQLTGRKPEHSFQNNCLPDPEQYSLVYPRVAVQLPMFNERAVCQAIIDSACELSWPKNRFKVQVGQLVPCFVENTGGSAMSSTVRSGVDGMFEKRPV